MSTHPKWRSDFESKCRELQSQGNTRGTFGLAISKFSTDPSQGFKDILSLAQKGYAPAYFYAGEQILSRTPNSRKTVLEWTTAFGYFVTASSDPLDKGHSAYRCYEVSKNISSDKREHAKWLKIAANQGHPSALYQLGVLSSDNPNEAFKYFKEAASKDHVDATYKTGLYLKKGFGTNMDIDEAAVYFKKSSEMGCLDSKLELAEMLYDGVGVVKSPATGAVFLREVFRAGSKEQQDRAKAVWGVRESTEDPDVGFKYD